ncbi:MAG: hypoxanthine phosphoribosyltransferase [archaeon]
MGSEPIFVPDDQRYALNQFEIPKKYVKDLSSIMISSGQINNRIEKLAKDVNEVYAGKDIFLLCVLKGAFNFFADLVHFLDKYDDTFGFDFIRVSSYDGRKSTGELMITEEHVLKNVVGKDVLVVEDIVDSALTMSGLSYIPGKEITGGLIGLIKKYNPESVRTISLLTKRTDENNGYQPDFAGFSIPNEFVVGYGLDYNQRFRSVPHIAIMSEAGIKKYEKKK